MALMKKLFIIFLLLFSVICYAETQIYFSPQGGAREAIIDCINKADTEIKICMYAFTDKVLFDELLKMRNKGVKVMIILDKLQAAGVHSLSKELQDKFIVKIQRGVGRGIMHEKFVIVDKKYYILGSYNFTQNAYLYNRENIAIIDDEDIAARATAYWKFLWKTGK